MLRRQRLDVGVLQDVEAFGIGLHQAVFDAVVDHLDEMAGADRARRGYSPARCADRGRRGPACAECRRCPAPAPRKSDRAGRPRPCRRRSSCNSRARGPRRRRWCRRRRNGCPCSFSALARRMSSCQKVLPPSMMTSPRSISLASASMVDSVILPAGSITQTVRGFSSLPTKSSSSPRRCAPSAASAATAFGVLVVDDGRVAVPHQPADDIAAHPPQADHAESAFADASS